MLIDDYLNYEKKYKDIYTNSLILMQVGSFFEMYSLEKEKIDTVCNILEIQSTRKNKSNPNTDKTNPFMAGFPLYTLDKYINILTENGYTIILIEQTTLPPNPKREITKIISPSTNIENNHQSQNNFLMTVYFSYGSNRNKDIFITSSISFVDINTNDTFIFNSSEEDSSLNLEDIIKTINNNKPSEIVLITDIQIKSKPNLIYLLNEFTKSLPSNICIHNKINSLIDENFFKLSYQNAILKKVFRNTGLLSVVEFLDLEMKQESIISFVYLLQFCYDHNEKILEGIKKPIFLENTKYLALINNALENLNIIPKDKNNNKTSSILNLLNNCKTNIGKRYFKQCLINPIINSDAIKERYDMCDYFINNDLYSKIRIHLSKISDLERLFKRMSIQILQPAEMGLINTSLITLQGVHKELSNLDFLKVNWSNEKQKNLEFFISDYQKKFNLEEMEKTNLNQISKNLFNKNIFLDLDEMENEILNLENIFEKVIKSLNIGCEKEEFKLELNKDKIRTIIITKNRYDTMLKDQKRCNLINKTLEKEQCNLTLNDITSKLFSSTNKTTLKIEFKNMNRNQSKLTDLQFEFSQKVSKLYLESLKYFYENFQELFKSINEFIGKIDFYSCNAKNAIENCYVRPNIISSEEKSFIKAEKIRHPLIEKINIDIPYISNDIELGTENKKGMLLYGLNSSGKSSLMKSIGVNLIMAQAGMYVACKSFEFSSYHHIFSRVVGGDNIFKQQSTFVSEINELRTILKRSTDRSLILGDELLSSTESISAIAIVGSGINSLSKKESSFLFASHLHELCNLECVKNLKNIGVFHLSVDFNKEKNCLIYNRILKEGNGNTLYGLEVARSLDLPADFLLFANQVRQEYTNTNKYIVEPRKSVYNNSVFFDKCSICNEECNEIHHIKEQNQANSKGIIEKEQIHKNIKHNLIETCIKCHDKIHSNEIKVNGYIQTSNGVKLDFENMINQNENDIEIQIKKLRIEGKSYSKILELIKNEFKNEKITLYRIKKILDDKNK